MSERDKQTARDIIDAYRRRQKVTQNIILAIGLVVILLIVAVFVIRFVRPGAAPLAAETQTPAATETGPPTPTPRETLRPTDSLSQPSPATETPPLEETPGAVGTSIYQVQEGDTLATIALRFNTDLQTLLNLNPDIDPDLLSLGQEITVPAETSVTSGPTATLEGFSGVVEYQVVSGDTLFGIAERFNSSVSAIVAENGLEDANDIRAGDVLRIPVNATPTAPAGATPTAESTVSSG
jgi:LysM repeat protein